MPNGPQWILRFPRPVTPPRIYPKCLSMGNAPLCRATLNPGVNNLAGAGLDYRNKIFWKIHVALEVPWRTGNAKLAAHWLSSGAWCRVARELGCVHPPMRPGVPMVRNPVQVSGKDQSGVATRMSHGVRDSIRRKSLVLTCRLREVERPYELST